ncbi:MAG: hypothetical protein AABW48_03375 [Nanoarchaeota archaeon]
MFLLLVFFLLIFFLISFTPVSNVTGGATSRVSNAGAVEEVNLSLTEESGYWQGFYGEIFEDSSFNQTPSSLARKGNITELNVTFPCVGEEIYASTNGNIAFKDISAGRKEAIDHYLQLNASHLESGSQIFANTKTFTVGSSAIANIPTSYTKVFGSPGNTTFDLGLLNISNSLVFVSHISLDTKGFDNKTHDYQMLVPVNGSFVTYYFFSDCEAAVSVPVPVYISVGGAGEIKKEARLEMSFELSEELIKVALTEGERLEKKIRVLNTGKADLLIKTTTALSALLTVSPNAFYLPQGREKEITFIFNPYLNIKPGIYTGAMVFFAENDLRSISKAAYIILEVEPKEVIFDASLDLPKKTYFPGEELKAIITLLNLKKTYPADVTLIHLIMDMNNNIIYDEEERITMWNQVSFSKIIPLSQNITVGQYLYALKVIYGSSFTTATESFTVVEPGPPLSEALVGMAALMDKRTFYLFGIPVLLLLLVITIFLILFLIGLRVGKFRKSVKLKKRM